MKPEIFTRLIARAQKMKPAGKRTTVIAYIVSRASYEPPSSASDAETEEVLLSAAVAAARVLSKSDDENGYQRDFLAKMLIAGLGNEKMLMQMLSRYVTGSLDEVANFYRNAQLARENFRVVDSRSTPMNDLAIIENWIVPPQGGKRFLSFAECSAVTASEVMARIMNTTVDANNWPRTKKRLGLVSFKRPLSKRRVLLP